jgi:hypothetical protein
MAMEPITLFARIAEPAKVAKRLRELVPAAEMPRSGTRRRTGCDSAAGSSRGDDDRAIAITSAKSSRTASAFARTRLSNG